MERREEQTGIYMYDLCLQNQMHRNYNTDVMCTLEYSWNTTRRWAKEREISTWLNLHRGGEEGEGELRNGLQVVCEQTHLDSSVPHWASPAW